MPIARLPVALSLALLVSASGAAGVLPAAAQSTAVDCAGPAPDAEPGTPAYLARDAANIFCTQERHLERMASSWTEPRTSS